MRYWKNMIMLAAVALLVLLVGYAVSGYFADRSADAEPTKVMLRKRIADAQLPIPADPSIRQGAVLAASFGATADGSLLEGVAASRLHALL